MVYNEAQPHKLSLCGTGMAQKNGKMIANALSELWCFLLSLFPPRGWRQLCAHVKTEREAIVIEMDFCLSLGKRQNLSFPAEPCARCWRGLAQQATLMSQRSWIVLLSALSLSRPLWRKFFCFVLAFFANAYLFIFNNIIPTYHDESTNVRQTERERERLRRRKPASRGCLRVANHPIIWMKQVAPRWESSLKWRAALACRCLWKMKAHFLFGPFNFCFFPTESGQQREVFPPMLNNWVFGSEPVKIYSPLLSLDPVARQDGIRSPGLRTPVRRAERPICSGVYREGCLRLGFTVSAWLLFMVAESSNWTGGWR